VHTHIHHEANGAVDFITQCPYFLERFFVEAQF